MLKALFVICVLQTVVLLFLSSRFIMLEDEVASNRMDSSAIVQSQTPPSPQPTTVAVSTFSGDAKLRQIISEELARALEDVRAVGGNANPSPPQSLQSGTGYERRRKDVAESIDYYASVGRISEREMSRLQQDIAQLNPDDRREMMGAIVRAMNNGRLDGQL